jgi:hypothetical protein
MEILAGRRLIIMGFVLYCSLVATNSNNNSCDIGNPHFLLRCKSNFFYVISKSVKLVTSCDANFYACDILVKIGAIVVFVLFSSFVDHFECLASLSSLTWTPPQSSLTMAPSKGKKSKSE